MYMASASVCSLPTAARYWPAVARKDVINCRFLLRAASNNTSLPPNMVHRFTFAAGERLKREQHITALFRIGKALSFYPIRAVYTFVPIIEGEKYVVKVGFSVPKRKFKKATDRNKIKRKLREHYRLKKNDLIAAIPSGYVMHLFILYVGNEEASFPLLDGKMDKIVSALIEKAGGLIPNE